MEGPDGQYELSYSPLESSPWEGVIHAIFREEIMIWGVETALRESEGIVISGLAMGLEAIWRKGPWYELRLGINTVRLDYFGDRVHWRTDTGRFFPSEG